MKNTLEYVKKGLFPYAFVASFFYGITVACIGYGYYLLAGVTTMLAVIPSFYTIFRYLDSLAGIFGTIEREDK